MPIAIKAVIFDQGGVLSRGGEKGTNEKAASRAMGLSFVVEVPDLVEALKRGQISNDVYVDGINDRYPDAPTKLTDIMWDEVYASLVAEPASYRLVQKCRDSGRRVGLLSNINPVMAARLGADGSYDGFDPIVLSCEAGCAKPDPEIYAAIEAGLPGIAPCEILLLDDQEKCTRGAMARGWQAYVVTNIAEMVHFVEDLLELP